MTEPIDCSLPSFVNKTLSSSVINTNVVGSVGGGGKMGEGGREISVKRGEGESVILSL